MHNSAIAVVSSCIYGSTLIILYMMSTMYHALKVNNAKRVFRIIDHCSIFLLIAGTYTPYTLVALGGALGWTLFGIVWAAAGIWLLIAGGIIYTVGAIFYGIGKKIKYMHSIFHIFVIAGSILHFFSILLYVL